MDIIKIIGIGIVSLTVTIIIKQYRPEFSIYISIMAGLLIISLIIGKVSGIIDVLKTLINKAPVNNQFLSLLVKITGIAILTEYTVSLCKDSGENAIGNKVDIGGKVIIMSMSIPIISSLLESVIKILP